MLESQQKSESEDMPNLDEVNKKMDEMTRCYQIYCQAVAFKIVRDYDAAEDVVQNALVRAYLALQSYSIQKLEALRVRPWLRTIVVNEAKTYLTSKHELVSLDSKIEKWVDELEGPEQEHPEVTVIYEELKQSLDTLLNLLPLASQEVIEFWLRFEGSYQAIAQAFDSDVRTIRTRFHRATHRLKKIVNERRVRESDLRQWLQANLLALEEEQDVWKRDFSLRDYIKGEAYANVFGGHPYRGQFIPEDTSVPDAFLPPSYWN